MHIKGPGRRWRRNGNFQRGNRTEPPQRRPLRKSHRDYTTHTHPSIAGLTGGKFLNFRFPCWQTCPTSSCMDFIDA